MTNIMSCQFRRMSRHYLSSSPPAISLFQFVSTKPFVFEYCTIPSSSSSSSKPSNGSSEPIARSIANELLKDPESDPLSITQRLNLHFSNLINQLTPSLVLQTLKSSPEAGRTVLGYHRWLVKEAQFNITDETMSYFVVYFGKRNDFKAIHELLVENKGISGPLTLDRMIDRLVRAGRPTHVVSFFERMERDYGLKRDKESLRLIIRKLSANGFASQAEKMVKNLANEIFPDNEICDLLIKGWCTDGKFDEAKRLAGEMYRGGFEISAKAFNSLLDCVCLLCRKKDPFRMDSEVEKILVEMDARGVPRDVETFNVLIGNLCKIRRTQDAMSLFFRMNEWGCYPNDTTFLILIKSLFRAARLEEADEMIDRMKSAGYGGKLDKQTYHSFLRILCAIERPEHAMTVFEMMKANGCKPGLRSYDLLIAKWAAHNRLDKSNALYSEAAKSGLPLTPKEYPVDPRYITKPKEGKKEKKRETLPEKMARKRRRLKQIRLSFVKKPKRRSYSV